MKLQWTVTLAYTIFYAELLQKYAEKYAFNVCTEYSVLKFKRVSKMIIHRILSINIKDYLIYPQWHSKY